MAQFRVLGPLELVIAGESANLGPPKQRATLAALVVDAGQPVPVPVLVDRVWDQQPPAGARNALYVHVMRIRRLLAPVAASPQTHTQLRRRPDGYLLDVDPDAVDLHRFRRLVGTARQPAVPQDRRAALLDEALGLWRGDPLAGLDGSWPQQVRENCRRQRLEATLDWAEAQLTLQHPDPVIARLGELADDHPLVEPLAASLMRALQQAGRTAEALDRYATVRQHLAEELGIDPGDELRILHQALLTGGPQTTGGARPGTGDRPAGTTGPGTSGHAPRNADPGSAQPVGPAADETPADADGVPVPRQLPAAPPHFVGRRQELDGLTELLGDALRSGSGVTAAVTGVGGMGKTWLALHWAHQHLSRFPDGQLYVNLRGFSPDNRPLPVSTAIHGFLEALGTRPESIPRDLDGQTALYRSLMAGRTMLVLLDNARDADQVRALLPGSASHSFVVITSRDQLVGLLTTEGAHPLPLDPLSTQQSLDLLAHRLGRERTAAWATRIDQIVASCAGLPLALSIVAARASTNRALSPDDLIDRPGRLDALATGEPAADVRAVLSWSWRALRPEPARLFRLLGLHPGPDISAAAAASLVGLPVTATKRILEHLARAHLVSGHGLHRYTSHDLVRAYAAELAAEEDDGGARQRLYDHYVHTAHAAALLTEPHRDVIDLPAVTTDVTVERLHDRADALRWLNAERPVLLAIVADAERAGYDGHAWRLSWALATFLSRQAYWQDLASVQRIALRAATHGGDALGQAHTLRELALAAVQVGRHDEAVAHLRDACALFVQLDLPSGHAYTRLYLGWVYELQGRQRAALAEDERALSLFAEVGHKVGQARALNALGWDHAQLGDLATALDYCLRALTLHEAMGNVTAAAQTWDSLGYIHHRLAEYDRAVACFERALELSRQVGDRFQEAESLLHLGESHLCLGRPDAARQAWQRAAALLRGSPAETERLRRRLLELDEPPPTLT
ncbi:BTAD domain-containing putative transcriptional regulator [Micromonospora sp. WMMD964]|uniref:AfsR/SARP family transcriptional regulator n=1 Tax=Micromonospora sp. WMMD964 TaxID=3016091 RepID=UPI00249A70AC|nr:BTAD domain-containing putative transcriptional regulator [Micromonospora sp. WMMD964]WFF00127.1 BTAD domain-containing putative transcriptional regulator [Micromonospora sp. WMMD964]